MLSWYKTFATQWTQSYLCKTRTSHETQKSLQNFLEQTWKPKVIYTDKSLEFDKTSEDLSWNHCTSTPIRNKLDCWKSSAQNNVLLQSGLNESWCAVSMESYCHLRDIQGFLSDGKTLYERRFGEPFKRPIIPFGSIDFISPYFCVITLNRESNCTCREKKSFPTPRRYIEVTRATSTTLDVMLERRIDDYWNIDGAQDLSDSWIGFTRFTILDKQSPDGYTWSDGPETKKQTTSRPDDLWPEIWRDMSEAAKRKEKQKWAVEKPKLDNAGRLRGIYFIDPADADFKETVENTRRKLEVPMTAAMALLDQGKKVQGNLSHSWCSQDKVRIIVEPD